MRGGGKGGKGDCVENVEGIIGGGEEVFYHRLVRRAERAVWRRRGGALYVCIQIFPAAYNNK